MSPVWKRGSMLVPCVLTYVVAPPSANGQKNQTAASTSALMALMLAALMAAFMAKAPVRESGGGRNGLPPSQQVLLDHRHTGRVEVREVAVTADSRVTGHDDDRGVPRGLLSACVRIADDDGAARGLQGQGHGLGGEVRRRSELDRVDDRAVI